MNDVGGTPVGFFVKAGRKKKCHKIMHVIPSFPPGWLHKEMKNSTKASLKLKKRWFLLTHNSLDYYKSSERNALKLGTLVLNSLCSVVQPDEKVFKEAGE